MINFLFFTFVSITVISHSIFVEALPVSYKNEPSVNILKTIGNTSKVSTNKSVVLAQNRSQRRHHRASPRASVPLRNSRVIFRTNTPIYIPGYALLPSEYVNYINGEVYQRYPNHCSYVLGYSQKRILPSGWTVSSFNREVDFCRTAFFPTVPDENILQINPLPQPPIPPPSPEHSSFDIDNSTCRQLAYQASEGGAGLNKTVEGGIVGGAMGAAAGAAIGAATGNPGKGAAVGAMAGGIGGATVNNFEASQEYNTAYENCMRNRGHEISFNYQ